MLKPLLEPRLYSDMSDYLKESINLHDDVKLTLENQETQTFEIYLQRYYFMAGFHVDRARNEKECRVPYKPKVDNKSDFMIYLSKLPMKFTTMPLNLVFELVYKTNMKLNITRSDMSLFTEEEVDVPEYHYLRFEGCIGDFTNDVNGLLKMKNKYTKFKRNFEKGQLDDVQEWTITDIDHCMNEKLIKD